MNPEIKLTFRYLPGEYVRAVNEHQLSDRRLIPDLIISWVVAGIGIWTIRFGTEQYFWFGVIICGIGLAYSTLVAVMLVVVPRAMIAGNPKLRDEYQLTFSDQGVRFQTASIDSNLDWSLYQRAVEGRDFYFLYWSRRQFTVIPKRAFATADDRLVFNALLAAHIAKVDRRV